MLSGAWVLPSEGNILVGLSTYCIYLMLLVHTVQYVECIMSLRVSEVCKEFWDGFESVLFKYCIHTHATRSRSIELDQSVI